MQQFKWIPVALCLFLVPCEHAFAEDASLDRYFPKIKYAEISQPDLLISCPMESFPEPMGKAHDLFISKINESVSKIKKARGSDCSDLDNRLRVSQGQLGDAIRNQYIAASLNTSSSNSLLVTQQQINVQTRPIKLLEASTYPFRAEQLRPLCNPLMNSSRLIQICLMTYLC
jgi:hypothetical protein